MWVEFGCEEKEEQENKKKEEENKLNQAKSVERKRDMVVSLEQVERRKLAEKQEAQYERLWVMHRYHQVD